MFTITEEKLNEMGNMEKVMLVFSLLSSDNFEFCEMFNKIVASIGKKEFDRLFEMVGNFYVSTD